MDNNNIKKKLKNAKQKLDRSIQLEVSEWEMQEDNLGRSKLYGNLKNKIIRQQIQSCLALVENIMIKTYDKKPNDPEICKVLYMLKSSLGTLIIDFLFYFNILK